MQTKEVTMPDIAMCDNKKCVLRNICYRYRAVPDCYQSYSVFEPKFTKGKYVCDSFWNCEKTGYKLRDTKVVDNQKPVFDE